MMSHVCSAPACEGLWQGAKSLDDIISAVARMPALQHLCLTLDSQGRGFRWDMTLPHLASLKALTLTLHRSAHVSLPRLLISQTTIRSLSVMFDGPSSRTGQCAEFSQVFSALLGMKQLTSLSLGRSGSKPLLLDTRPRLDTALRLPALKRLSLRNLNPSLEVMLLALASATALTALRLRDCGVTAEQLLPALEKHPNAVQLDVQ